MEFTFRKLRKEDLGRGYFDTLSNLSPADGLSLAAAEKLFDEFSERDDYFHTVAVTDDGDVVGATTLFLERKYTRGGAIAGHVEDVATRKGWERRGIARGLMEFITEEAKRRSCYKIILDCDEDNMPFYQKFGFAARGREMYLKL